MKKSLLFFVFVVCVSNVSAQQRYPGQWILRAGGGANITNAGLLVDVGMEIFLNNPATSFIFTFSYNQNKYSHNSGDIDVKNYYGNFLYAYTITPLSRLRIAVAGGIFLGNQKVPKIIDNGVLINARSGFVWGLSGGPELDYAISTRISLFLQPTLSYCFRSDVDAFNFKTTIGIKYFF